MSTISYWRVYDGTTLMAAIAFVNISGRIIATRVVEYELPLEMGKIYTLISPEDRVGYSVKIVCWTKAYPLDHDISIRQQVDFEFIT